MPTFDIKAKFTVPEASGPTGFVKTIIGFNVEPLFTKEGQVVTNDKTGDPALVFTEYTTGGKGGQEVWEVAFSGVPKEDGELSWMSRIGQFIIAMDALGVPLAEIEDDETATLADKVATVLNQSFAGLRVRQDRYKDYTPVVGEQIGRTTFGDITLSTEVFRTDGVLDRASEDELLALRQQAQEIIEAKAKVYGEFQAAKAVPA